MKEKVKLSPAVQLIDLVWKESFGRKKVTSWTIFNSALQDALQLAIKAGMDFDKDDFQYINANFSFSYWGGNDGHMLGERYYSLAVLRKNMKAAQSFESWKFRGPFIFDDVKFEYGFNYGAPKEYAHARLAIGAGFQWNNEQVKVTSFTADGSYLVACSYKEKVKDERGFEGTEQVKHQYKITVKDLKAERARRKKIKHVLACANMRTVFYNWLADLLEVTFPDTPTRRIAFNDMMVPREV